MNYQEKYQKHQELDKEFKKKLSIVEKVFTGPNKEHQTWYNERIREIYGPYLGKQLEINWE